MSDKADGLVSNGSQRLREDALREIEVEVRSDFAREIAEAGFVGRLMLRFEMRSEIRRRANELERDSANINWARR